LVGLGGVGHCPSGLAGPATMAVFFFGADVAGMAPGAGAGAASAFLSSSIFAGDACGGGGSGLLSRFALLLPQIVYWHLLHRWSIGQIQWGVKLIFPANLLINEGSFFLYFEYIVHIPFLVLVVVVQFGQPRHLISSLQFFQFNFDCFSIIQIIAIIIIIVVAILLLYEGLNLFQLSFQQANALHGV
jgi:hypothetical protein